MDLYILRHGRAEEAGAGRSDANRRLTMRGKHEIEHLAAWMKAQDIRFDLIAASPLVRAQQTAAIVAESLKNQEVLVTWETLLPGCSPDTVSREVDRYADLDAILLVGHEPLLSALVARIVAGDDGAGIVMTKGAPVKIRDFSLCQRPSGELQWLVAPRLVGFRRE